MSSNDAAPAAAVTTASDAATESSHKHACLTCCVRYVDASHWREHFKTDWHRYNLKRNVVDLAPVTAEQFHQRIVQQRNKDAGTQKYAQYCKECRKQFHTAKSFENHLSSKAHRDNVEAFAIKEVVAVQLASEEAELDRLQETARVAKKPAEQMDTEAALDSDDIADEGDDDDDDEDGSVEEVDSDEWDEEGEEAADNSYENPIVRNKCLFCLQRSASLEENLKHMSSMHSFFVPDTEYVVDLPGLMRYLGEKVARDFICLWCNDRGRTFFSYDAARKHMRDKGHCKMLHEGLALAEYAEFYDYSSSYPDNNDDLDIDEELPDETLDGDEYQLVLPSGAVIGHRSLMRYYKQRLNPARALVPTTKTNKRLHRVLAEYRSLGWTQTHQAQAAQKARDIHKMKRTYQNWYMLLGKKANKLQRHFRQQVDF